ncbi:hypothetical protein A0H81_10531 [Grifola frondosa]|uniref:Uncharacterized protein n=1 Tax=Grifola frondosa TaxID=5627 RepID=A0A1C7M029_GRIFR|nr:hypothetical protein A0H81_10531 [Grifola frondosa]
MVAIFLRNRPSNAIFYRSCVSLDRPVWFFVSSRLDTFNTMPCVSPGAESITAKIDSGSMEPSLRFTEKSYIQLSAR